MTEVRIPAPDRRDDLRRRIYLACMVVGVPVLLATWLVHRQSDPFVGATFVPYALGHLVVAVLLWPRRISVRTAERVVLALNAVQYLASLAVALAAADDLAGVVAQTTGFPTLTANMLVVLAYLAFDNRPALRASLAIVGAYLGIVAVTAVGRAAEGQIGSEVVDLLRMAMSLVATLGLLHLLAQVKEQAAEARIQARAMEALANTDPLTGLANRRHLHAALESQVGAAAAGAADLAVVLVDIDRFKLINDTFGHDVGDDVLRQIAVTLTGVVRAEDVVGRWGGEEFVVISPATSADGAADLAERCRAAIAATDFPGIGGVTASLGVAVWQPGDAAWPLLRRADEALYRAKSSGRDRVVQQGEIPAA